MNTLDDNFLIRQTLEGNKNAFRFLVIRYQKPIFKFLSTFNLHSGMIEEVAQETFVRAFKSLKNYDPDKGASFSTWLFVICKRLALNELARSSYVRESTGQEVETGPSGALSPEDSLSLKQTRHTIQSALEKVPLDYRRAVVLSQIDEHSLLEIAEIENCSVGTVKSRIHRGKKLLRELLSGPWEAL